MNTDRNNSNEIDKLRETIFELSVEYDDLTIKYSNCLNELTKKENIINESEKHFLILNDKYNKLTKTENEIVNLKHKSQDKLENNSVNNNKNDIHLTNFFFMTPPTHRIH